MSILSDSTIAQLCHVPTTKVDDDDGHLPMISPFLPELVRAVTQPCHPIKMSTTEALEEWYRLNGPRKTSADYPELTGDEARRIIRARHDRAMTDCLQIIGRMVHPQEGVTETFKIISKGLTSFGYDVSLTEEVKIFTNVNSAEIDPKRFDEERCLVTPMIKDDVDGGRYVTLPANSYLLGVTAEYFAIPKDILVVCVGKSTYARAGVIVNTTPIEPGFEGNVVIEVANTTPSPVRIYLNEGISQFLFFRGDQPCATSYKDRGGKYQGQTGVTMSKV